MKKKANDKFKLFQLKQYHIKKKFLNDKKIKN